MKRRTEFMMETKIYVVPIEEMNTPASQKALSDVGGILRRGGLAAIPTETVYGLAADAGNPQAVKNIFVTKGRQLTFGRNKSRFPLAGFV